MTLPAATVPTYRQPFVGDPDLLTDTGFILAEDAALHRYLDNIMVPNLAPGKPPTKVGVWFRFPQGERQLHYPFITIDLIDVSPDYALWTSEYEMDTADLYRPSVAPTLPALVSNQTGYVIRPYLPFSLTYQVSVHTRSAHHDKYLQSLFFTDIFPPRPFWLGVEADNTWRRTEMVDFAQQDVPETTESGNKRIFRKIYTLSMMAEVPQDRLPEIWKVLRVFVAITNRDQVDEYLESVAPYIHPDLTVSEVERRKRGEVAYYVNESAMIAAGTASATGTANNAG